MSASKETKSSAHVPRNVPSENPVSDNSGTVVGPYVLGKTVGRGVFGKVKLAHDKLHRPFAVKIYEKRRFIRTKHATLQVEKEINALRICHGHPNVIGFIEVLETKHKLYVVMEYVGGGELYDYIKSNKRVAEPLAARMFYQIVSAMRHCHSRGVVHRDLKPENILLDKDLNVKICDFGLCNYVDNKVHDSITEAYTAAEQENYANFLETQCGSPHYAAPEVLNGVAYLGMAVDIWSCGIILYALLFGRLPFNGKSIPVLRQRISSGKYSFPTSVEVSMSASTLVKKILMVDAPQRPSLDAIMSHAWLAGPKAEAEAAESSSPHNSLSTHSEQRVEDNGQNTCPTCSKPFTARHAAVAYVELMRFFNQDPESEDSTEEGADNKNNNNNNNNTDSNSNTTVDLCACNMLPIVKKVINKPSTEESRDFLFACESGEMSTVHGYIDSNSDITVVGINNFTALHFAARYGNLKLCHLLLTCLLPLDIDARTKTGWTSLMLATYKGHVEVAKTLIEYGADIHAVNTEGKSVIFLAREGGANTEMARILTQRSTKQTARRGKKLTAESLNWELLTAAETGDHATVAHLLAMPKEYGIDVCVKGMDNWTPLHFAARRDNQKVLRSLLRKTTLEQANVATKNGWTPLMMATDKGNEACMRMLLEAKANVTCQTDTGLTAADLLADHELPDARIAALLQRFSAKPVVVKPSGPAPSE